MNNRNFTTVWNTVDKNGNIVACDELKSSFNLQSSELDYAIGGSVSNECETITPEKFQELYY